MTTKPRSILTRCSALVAAFFVATAAVPGADDAPGVANLRSEVHDKGWLLFSARTDQGDYDLFLSRPDGSEKRDLTKTPELSEYGGRFSSDGKQILYRRAPKAPPLRPGEGINHDTWGAAGALVIANADGSNPRVMGKDGEFPWASWSPDGRQLACLYRREGKIRIHDVETGKIVKEMPRQGVFQQLFWSPDGKRLCGTANLNGQDWNILSLDTETGKATQVSRNLCCTPDWFQGDPQRIIYSCRIPGIATADGFTMLMQGTADGKSRTLIYGERNHHIYYGGTSPDNQYAVFAVPESDGGTDAEMAIVRLVDAPIIVPEDYRDLRELYPSAKSGPVLKLGVPGFEPYWTYVALGGGK